MKLCPKCKNYINDSSSFCPSCGYKLPDMFILVGLIIIGVCAIITFFIDIMDIHYVFETDLDVSIFRLFSSSGQDAGEAPYIFNLLGFLLFGNFILKTNNIGPRVKNISLIHLFICILIVFVGITLYFNLYSEISGFIYNFNGFHIYDLKTLAYIIPLIVVEVLLIRYLIKYKNISLPTKYIKNNKCIYCNTINSNDNTFCGNCGAPIKNNIINIITYIAIGCLGLTFIMHIIENFGLLDDINYFINWLLTMAIIPLTNLTLIVLTFLTYDLDYSEYYDQKGLIQNILKGAIIYSLIVQIFFMFDYINFNIYLLEKAISFIPYCLLIVILVKDFITSLSQKNGGNV